MKSCENAQMACSVASLGSAGSCTKTCRSLIHRKLILAETPKLQIGWVETELVTGGSMPMESQAEIEESGWTFALRAPFHSWLLQSDRLKS